MAAIRELLVAFDVVVNDTQLDRFSRKLDTGLLRLREFAGSIGVAFAAVALKNMTSELLNNATALAQESDQLGENIETMQVWRKAAEDVGATTEDLRIAFKAITKNANESLGANKQMAKRFDDLGVSVTGAGGELKSASELLLDIGGSLEQFDEGSKRAAVAQTILGEASLKLLPIFKNGRAGAEAMLAQIRELGGGFSEEFARDAEAVSKELADLNFVFTSLQTTLLAFVLPAIKTVALWLQRTSRFIGKVAKETAILESSFSLLGFAGLIKGFQLLGVWISRMSRPFVRLFGLLRSRGMGTFRAFGATLLRLLRPLTRFAARVLLPIFALDSLITFFQGGATKIGDALDAMFGAGFSTKVQQLIGAAAGVLRSIFAIIFADDPEARAKAQQELLAWAEMAGLLLDDIADQFAPVLERVSGMIRAAFEIMLDDLLSTFKGWAKKLWESFGIETDAALADLVSRVLSVLINPLSGFFELLRVQVSGLFKQFNLLRRAADFVLGDGPGSSGPTVPAPGAGGPVTVEQTNHIRMNNMAAPGESAVETGRAAAGAIGAAVQPSLTAVHAALSQGA